MHLGTLVEMLGEVRVALPHNGVRDDRINLDSGYAGAAIGDRTKNVHSAARPDDRVIAMRPERIHHRWRRSHQVILPLRSLPALRISIHDEGVRVGIDNDHLGAGILAVHFHSSDGIPARKLDILSPNSLGPDS